MKDKVLTIACLLIGLLAQAAAAEAPPVLPATIPVRLLPGSDLTDIRDIEHIRLVKGSGPVTLQIDAVHKRVLNAQGRLVAEADPHHPLSLQSTVDKWRYVEAFNVLASTHRQQIQHIAPHDQQGIPVAYNGEVMYFQVMDVPPERQVVVFDLAPNGSISYLYHRLDAVGGSDVLDGIAKAPFGADHIVVVTAKDPAGMSSLVRWVQETAQADGVLDTQGLIFKQIAQLKDVRVGMVPSYTCKSEATCP